MPSSPELQGPQPCIQFRGRNALDGHHGNNFAGPRSCRGLRCQLIAERKDEGVFGALRPPATILMYLRGRTLHPASFLFSPSYEPKELGCQFLASPGKPPGLEAEGRWWESAPATVIA